MSNFRDWTREKLKQKFGLRRVKSEPFLEHWLAQETALSPIEIENLNILHSDLTYYIDFWNEEELKIKFIGNLISMTRFDTEDLSSFADRELSGTVEDEVLTGKPDIMVAKGKQEVQTPFFCLHEYKKELDNNSPDPAGQCLVAMLLAYEKNKSIPVLKDKPIYGAYVIGRSWFFMTLKEREYAISLSYDALHLDQLYKILQVLKTSRKIIMQLWETINMFDKEQDK